MKTFLALLLMLLGARAAGAVCPAVCVPNAGYPWPTCGCLAAADLNSAIANLYTAISSATTPKVTAYGAKCDGVTDDTAAIQAGLNASASLILPTGTCLVSSTLTVAKPYTAITGQGPSASFISNTTPSQATITVPSTVFGVTFEGFTVTRPVTAIPTSAGTGFDFSQGIFRAFLNHVGSSNNWVGFALGPTPYSECSYCLAEQNFSDGFHFTNSVSSQTAQWALTHTLSQGNNGWGYSATATAGTTMVFLDWIDAETFANKSGGMTFNGASTAHVEGPDLIGGALSTDGGTELYLDTYGEGSKIVGTAIELAGTAATGRGLLTAASNVGYGIQATGNNTLLQISSVEVLGNSQHGLSLGAFRTTLTGSWIIGNGQAAAGTYSGVFAPELTSGGTLTATGNIIGNETSSGTIQKYGINVNDGAQLIATANDLCFNVTAAFNVVTNSTSAQTAANQCAAVPFNGLACTGSPTSSFATNAAGQVTHC